MREEDRKVALADWSVIIKDEARLNEEGDYYLINTDMSVLIASTITSALSRPGWQDIATAPRDKVVLLSDGNFRWFDKVPSEFLDIDAWITKMGSDPPRLPTHWMETGLPKVEGE